MAIKRKRPNLLKGAFSILHEEGLLSLLIRALQKLQRLQQRKTSKKQHIVMLAAEEDILKADWTNAINMTPKSVKSPCTLVWVMSPPGESGGGHQNIFRFIKFLDQKGYRNIVYLYSTTDFPTTTEVRDRIGGFYKLAAENVRWHKKGAEITEGDAIFATGWETAYPVYNARKDIKKFYFVQDFEPLFYPMGSEYILAENTYKFGFTGITAGRWLTEKLQNDYGMKCDFYEFGAEGKTYNLVNTQKRKEIFFYARPITARRGFELGILALKKFHEEHPDYVINLAGWDVSEYEIPFPYVNHKALKINELSGLYNRCAAALVVSLTNMSLLPLELLATGTIPVVNDSPNNRLVSNNPYIEYTSASPDALAAGLARIVSREDLPTYSQEAAASVKTNSWDISGDRFIGILEKELNG